MTPEQFAYWMQGFAELTPDAPSAAQWQAIRDHLALVFEKKTPTSPSLTFPANVRRPLNDGTPADQLPTEVRDWMQRNRMHPNPTITC